MTYWSEIVEAHGPDVWRTAYRLLNHAQDAGDCYQETYLKAFEYAERNAVASWPAVLRRIATTRAMDMLRQRYRRGAYSQSTSVLDDDVADGNPSPLVCAELKESMEQLRQAIAELPAVQAEVFWLSEVEFLSHDDIASQLGGTTKQVALWLHRAKQKLRELLSARGITNEVRR